MARTISTAAGAPRISSRFSTSALYSRASTRASSVSGLTSCTGCASTRSAEPVPASPLPGDARYRPSMTATSMPLGNRPASLTRATTATRAYAPSTRGTSRTRPSAARAASMAARASPRSSGTVITMPGSTAALFSGRSGSSAAFAWAKPVLLSSFNPGTAGAVSYFPAGSSGRKSKMTTARGAFPDKAALDRLVSDLRVLDADGIERAAWAWDRHESRELEEYRAAERAALASIEQADLGPFWEDFRRTLFGLTESREALVHWKAKHGDMGHKAERAAFGAALGLFARDR